MKKALVEPSGRVAQVEAVNPDPKSGGIPFPIAAPLRWVDCADDATPATHIFDGGAVVPIPAVVQAAPSPDVPGFVLDLKAAMGGIVAANGLAKAYPLFYPALQNSVFSDVQALIIDAHATLVLSDAQYAAFKSLAAKHNIPIVLP